MTITRRPRPAAKTTPTPTPTKSPEAFIENAPHPVVPEPAAPLADKAGKKKSKDKAKVKDKEAKALKKRKDKEAVLIRFEDDQLALMDAQAAALGLSRAAWLRMLVAKTLMEKKD